MSEIVKTTMHGDVAVIRFDDGKANTVSLKSIPALNAALDEAEKNAKSIVLAGRPGRFSAGFDLSVMRDGHPADIGRMVRGGAELAMRIYGYPLPVVIACTGHAIAMGSVLLLAADLRIGARGDFKLGLNEVAIGLTLPQFAVELANDRLSRRHLPRMVNLAELIDPQAAVEVGLLDRVVPPTALLDIAIAEAKHLTALDLRAHHGTKRNLRGPTLERIRASLGDIAPDA